MIILGSKSPRRKEILELLGLDFKIYVPDVEEDITDYNTPEEYVLKTALKKGLATQKEFYNDVVLCADTIVAIDNEILEKPKNKDDARSMINKIQGKYHMVYTSVYLGKEDKYDNFVCGTKVFISEMSAQEIEDYINTQEPYDKAGAYAIQGIFAKHIEKIEGDYYNVMGLPLNEVYNKLKNIM